jgi:hypothetical protein
LAVFSFIFFEIAYAETPISSNIGHGPEIDYTIQ